ncbi:MAG TPA: dephospho-CoA kinase [Armatimonadetes bacterium]|nr:dephospho-CoA kinase [Armatimonadota bacterium]
MYVLGLTGLIAAGKSSVSSLLAERGAVVIDCDQVAREVVAPGQPALAEIIAHFGPAYQQPDGTLDRAALGRLVFADPHALAQLEALTHPRIRAVLEARLADLAARGTVPLVVVEAVKLLQSGLHEVCDAVWVVRAPAEVRLRRLVADRGLDEATARQRIAAQGGGAALVAAAERVLDNDGDPAALAAAVEAAFRADLDPWVNCCRL